MKRPNQAQHKGVALVISGIIREKRRTRGLSQGELARMLGVTPASVSYFESGKRVPSIPTFIKIKYALNLSTKECLSIINAFSGAPECHLQEPI